MKGSRQTGCLAHQGQEGAGDRNLLLDRIQRNLCSDTANERFTAEQRNDLGPKPITELVT